MCVKPVVDPCAEAEDRAPENTCQTPLPWAPRRQSAPASADREEIKWLVQGGLCQR